jgi:riboflavin synthase
MFTGIVTDVGTVAAIVRTGDTRFDIRTRFDMASVPVGASIACAGVCLTVIERGSDWFAVTVSGETLSRTTLGGWGEGSPVNLERSLRLGDELGGHLVTGHIDGTATIVSIGEEGDSWRVVFEAPPELARYIAEKGSVTIDGVSLTVNEVSGPRFGVNLIPHTLAVTTLGRNRPGDRVNIEIDIIARYVARLVGTE